MKFTCEKSALSEAVMSAMRAVSLKSTIEALEGILVAAENGAVSNPESAQPLKPRSSRRGASCSARGLCPRWCASCRRAT